MYRAVAVLVIVVVVVVSVSVLLMILMTINAPLCLILMKSLCHEMSSADGHVVNLIDTRRIRRTFRDFLLTIY